MVDHEVENIRSSVIVCNHLSYLDPILLISLLQRAKTIVKPVFFSVPIFGWVLRKAGYFPAAAYGPHAKLMLEQMESMGRYLDDGGNLFIFPQGTRGRNSDIGAFHQGAFKIARYCRVPIYVVCIRNTERLFAPGKFFFFARKFDTIRIKIVERIVPDTENLGLSDLNARVRESLEYCMQNETGHAIQEHGASKNLSLCRIHSVSEKMNILQFMKELRTDGVI